MEIEDETMKHRVVGFFRHPVVRWIIKFVIIFVAVYLVFHGILMLALRTGTPYLAVTSNSMKHYDDGWKNYFLERGIDPSNFPFQGGFERGDLLIIQGVDARDIVIGDVVVFQVPGKDDISHRVVEKVEADGSLSFTTKGDANLWPLLFEYSIGPEQIRGKVISVIPKIGHFWLWLSGK